MNGHPVSEEKKNNVKKCFRNYPETSDYSKYLTKKKNIYSIIVASVSFVILFLYTIILYFTMDINSPNIEKTLKKLGIPVNKENITKNIMNNTGAVNKIRALNSSVSKTYQNNKNFKKFIINNRTNCIEIKNKKICLSCKNSQPSIYNNKKIISCLLCLLGEGEKCKNCDKNSLNKCSIYTDDYILSKGGRFYNSNGFNLSIHNYTNITKSKMLTNNSKI